MNLQMALRDRSRLVREQNVERTGRLDPKEFPDEDLSIKKLLHVERENDRDHHGEAFRDSDDDDDDGEDEGSDGVLKSDLPVHDVLNGVVPTVSLIHHELFEKEGEEDERGANVANGANAISKVR